VKKIIFAQGVKQKALIGQTLAILSALFGWERPRAVLKENVCKRLYRT